MRTVILAALLLLTAHTAQAQQVDMPDLQDPKYTVCSADTDCVRIIVPCSGYVSVNSAFQAEVQLWADQLATRVRCSTPTAPIPPKPRCAAKHCTVAAP